MSFIMKKHIARRTFPAWRRCDPGAAGARCDVAGDGPDGRAAEDPVRRHLLSSRDGARPLGAAGRGRASRQTAVHPRVARACQESVGRPVRALVEVRGAAGGDDRIRSLGRGGLSDGNQATQDGRSRCDGWQPDDRSDHRAADWRRHAAAVAAARRRGPELELQQLWRGLQLLVHQLDLVDRAADAVDRAVDADRAAPDGAESPSGVRAAVRQRRDTPSCAPRGSSSAAASSTRSLAS